MIEVLLVDDHAVVREGVKQLLDRTPDIRIVGEAPDSATALRLIDDRDWDLVVLDIALPDELGIETLTKIKVIKPAQPVLIFSGFGEDVYALRCIKAGAAGFLMKDCSPEDLRFAIRETARGEQFISPGLAKQLLQAATAPAVCNSHDCLTEREFDVMLRIARGQGLTEIGVDLNLSVKTISTYRTRVLEKMEFTCNADITRYVISKGLE